MRESTSMQQPNKGRLIWQNVRITDTSLISAPTASPEARQVGLLHGGEQLPEADDDIIQHGHGWQPPHAALAANQVLLDAALALDQERIIGLGGQCL